MRLSINAWACGKAAVAGFADDPGNWAACMSIPIIERTLFADEEPDLRNWRDTRVGWGLILPDNDSLSIPERARAVDAPYPIQALLADRPDAPVFRYRPESPNRWTTLLRDLEKGTRLAPAIGASAFGVGERQIPYYLLTARRPP